MRKTVTIRTAERLVNLSHELSVLALRLHNEKWEGTSAQVDQAAALLRSAGKEMIDAIAALENFKQLGKK